VSDPIQIWVRNDKGKVWGPLMPATLELLFDNQLIPGRVQLSLDGANYVYPARLPEVRDVVPQELWGEGGAPAAAAPAPAAPSKIPGGPPSLAPAAARPPPPSLTPSPGTVPGPPPARPAAPVAGPGAAAAAQARAAAAAAAGPVRTADKRQLMPDLGAPVVAPPPAPIAAVVMPTLELPPAGSLQTSSALRLFYLAASSDATGLLTLTLSDRTVQIHFRKGNPEFVDSTHAEDQLSTFLVKNQLATFEQLGKAEKEKARFGGELVGALFGLGLLNPGTAFQHLGQRAASILVRGLFAEHGTFTWEVKDLPSHKAMPLGNRWAVVSEQVRKLPSADLRRRLNAAIDLPVMKSGGQVAVADLRLSPQETRALSYFDGVRSLNQLMHDLPNEGDHLLRVAFLLKDFDAVSFAAVRVPAPEAVAPPPPPPVAAPAPKPPVVTVAAAAAPPRPVAPPPVAAPRPPPPRVVAVPPKAPTLSAAPATPLDPAAEIKQLTATFEKMKTQNHFEVLGVPLTADGGTVKAAYFKMARAYHPDTVPPGAPPQLAKLKEDIFGRVGEANRTLADDKLRAEYGEEVKSGNAGEKVDIAAILAAEEMFQKGTILVKARKFPEAVKMLDGAIKGADEAEYFAWRGYAKFFANADKKAGHLEAMKDINVCLKRNDKVAAVWYFQGHMSKLLGDLPAAKKFFNKCIQLHPDHLDAQRELRLMK